MSSIMKYCREIKLDTCPLPTSSCITSLNAFCFSSDNQNWKMKAKERKKCCAMAGPLSPA